MGFDSPDRIHGGSGRIFPKIWDGHNRRADLCKQDVLAQCLRRRVAAIGGGRLPSRALEQLCFSLSKRLSMNVGIHWPDMVVRPGQFREDAAAVGAAVLALSRSWELREGDNQV